LEKKQQKKTISVRPTKWSRPQKSPLKSNFKAPFLLKKGQKQGKRGKKGTLMRSERLKSERSEIRLEVT
jgi:hypothetical protein